MCILLVQVQGICDFHDHGMLCQIRYSGLICGEGTTLWVMKAANWHCENCIKVGINRDFSNQPFVVHRQEASL